MAPQHWLAKIRRILSGDQVELPPHKMKRLKDLGLKKRTVFRFSSSIGNFTERLKEHFEVYEWHPIRSIFEPTVFMGLYHWGDYWKFLWHRGPKMVFWCGGDVLNLEKSWFRYVIKHVKSKHICENMPELVRLFLMGISAHIHPILFFDDPNDYPVSFKPSKRPHVWLTCHPGREKEYGVDLVEEIANKVPEVTFHIFGVNKPVPPSSTSPLGYPNPDYIDYVLTQSFFPEWNKNVIYHGHVPSHEMDKMIRGYHCGLRTLDFDGCPHTVSKGVLLGQWPINFIEYPHTDSYATTEELIKLLKNLKNKKKPNLAGRKHWLRIITDYPWNH